MTLNEFKAWFEGFTEEMGDRPTAKQWARIKKRVKEIDGEVTPWPIFVDRYVRPYRRYWDEPIGLVGDTTIAAPDPREMTTVWCSAGRSEAASIS